MQIRLIRLAAYAVYGYDASYLQTLRDGIHDMDTEAILLIIFVGVIVWLIVAAKLREAWRRGRGVAKDSDEDVMKNPYAHPDAIANLVGGIIGLVFIGGIVFVILREVFG